MNGSFRFSDADLARFAKKWGWFVGFGFLLIILGIAAIAAAGFTTLVSVIFLGFLLLMGGVIITIDTFNTWWGKWKGFILHLVIGILYLIAGALLIKHPASASVSLTLLLGIFYAVVGVFRLVYSSLSQGPKWGWGMFSGLISLLLGILIMMSWPASSLYIIGLFVGIDLLFSGWSYVMIGLSAREWSLNSGNHSLR